MAATYHVVTIGTPVFNGSVHTDKGKGFLHNNLNFRVTNTKSGVQPANVAVDFIASYPLNLKEFKIKNCIISKKITLYINHLVSGHDLYIEIFENPFATQEENLHLGISKNNLNGTIAGINFFSSVLRSYVLANTVFHIFPFNIPIYEPFNCESNLSYLSYRFQYQSMTTNADIEFVDLAIVEKLNLASATYEWIAIYEDYNIDTLLEF